MRRTAALCTVAAALLLGGCARTLSTSAPAKGNLLGLTAKHAARADRHDARRASRPAVVLVEKGGLRAIDPVTAVELWSLRTSAAGHAVASSDTIFVPIKGHRLLAVDRMTGGRMWSVPMPGEAVTGIAAAGGVVVLTVIDRRRGRSRVVGLSAVDGQIRWARRSTQRFGAPAAVGGVAVVPLGEDVVGLRLHSGFEVARLHATTPRAPGVLAGEPHFERVAVRGGRLLAGRGTQWVDLGTALESKIEDLVGVEDGYADVFVDHDGLDPGFGDRERLQMWVDLSTSPAGSRSAVLLCRRGVVAMRVDAEGRPVEGQWAYLTRDEREFVAMNVSKQRVTLVREDGQIVTLGRRNGAEIDRIAGGAATVGALFVDVEEGFGTPSHKHPTEKQRRSMFGELVLDPDPRLLPAQLLATDLLWRDTQPVVRAAVGQLAAGEFRGEPTAAAAALRKHALDLVSSPWGKTSREEAAQMLADLAQRPSFLGDVRPPIGVLARAAVAAGDASMVPHLVKHLLHPSTPSGDLVELIGALERIDREDAAAGIAAFVRRYHADAQAIDESEALVLGVSALLRYANLDAPGDPKVALAREALSDLLTDPFTAPALFALVDANLPVELREEAIAIDDDPDDAPREG